MAVDEDLADHLHRDDHPTRRPLVLGDEFPSPGYGQWQAAVEKVLRRTGLMPGETTGAVEDVLATTTYDGITIHPLYTRAPEGAGVGFPGLAPFVRGSRPQGCVNEGWDVRQWHADPDAAVTNREILADLAGGAHSVGLCLGPAGVALSDLADALHGVHLDMAGVVLDAGAEFAEAGAALLELAAETGVPASALRGNLGADPLGVRARTGAAPDVGAAVELARRCGGHYPQLRVFAVDGLPYHEAGGSEAQELGCALAAATAYLRQLTAAGFDIDAACGLLEFRYAASADQFATIAKLRAARRLWDRVTAVCGALEPARAQLQHAVTSPAMLTRRDPWVNMLRTTVAAFAAGVGGAQAVTVLPFDAAIGLPDAFARRIARNTQSLLLEESHLAQVIDPAGGSWYVETLTDELAQAAWRWFQEIEAAGGMSAALDSGLIADRLARTWQARQNAVAHRSEALTGVSEFPDLDEQPVQRPPAPAQPGGGLPRHRYAEAFEALRDASDAHLSATGARPAAFLATLGPLAVHTARASFARNLLAAGGVTAPEAGPTDSVEDVVRAFREAGTTVVCLCSSDKVYAERAAETARALKDAGAREVWLAGRPDPTPEGPAPEGPAPEGIDGLVYAGCDALSTLRHFHRLLGTPLVEAPGAVEEGHRR